MSSSYDPSIPDLDEVARQVAEANAITDQILNLRQKNKDKSKTTTLLEKTLVMQINGVSKE